MVEVERLSRFRQRGDGGLQISGLVPDDTGMFQCFARNAAGEVQTSTYLAVTSELASAVLRQSLPPRMRLSSKPGAPESRMLYDAETWVPGGSGWLCPLFPKPVVFYKPEPRVQV